MMHEFDEAKTTSSSDQSISALKYLLFHSYVYLSSLRAMGIDSTTQESLVIANDISALFLQIDERLPRSFAIILATDEGLLKPECFWRFVNHVPG